MNQNMTSGLVLLGIAIGLFLLERPIRQWGFDKIIAVMRTVIGLIAIVFLAIGWIQ